MYSLVFSLVNNLVYSLIYSLAHQMLHQQAWLWNITGGSAFNVFEWEASQNIIGARWHAALFAFPHRHQFPCTKWQQMFNARHSVRSSVLPETMVLKERGLKKSSGQGGYSKSCFANVAKEHLMFSFTSAAMTTRTRILNARFALPIAQFCYLQLMSMTSK